MGGFAKADFLQGHSTLWEVTFNNRPLLQSLLMGLATLFLVHYEKEPSKDKQDLATFNGPQHHKELLLAWRYKERSSNLKSHRHVIQLIAKYIQDSSAWPDNDYAMRQSLIDPPNEGKKRKTKMGWDLSDRPLKKLRLEGCIKPTPSR